MPGDPPTRERAVAYTTIEAQNTWRNFVRVFYLSYTVRPKGEAGARCNFEFDFSIRQALGLAVHTWRRKAVQQANGLWHRRDEPAWHDPNILLTLCRVLGASNLPHVEAGLSGESRVFSDLPVFRNYFAHRNEESRRAATALATVNLVPISQWPSLVLLAVPAKKYQPLILEWLDDLVMTVEYLCS